LSPSEFLKILKNFHESKINAENIRVKKKANIVKKLKKNCRNPRIKSYFFYKNKKPPQEFTAAA
jgi:hypothetical protein